MAAASHLVGYVWVKRRAAAEGPTFRELFNPLGVVPEGAPVQLRPRHPALARANAELLLLRREHRGGAHRRRATRQQQQGQACCKSINRRVR